MIRVAIVEDEDAAAGQLAQCLEKFGAASGQAFSSARFSDAVSFLEDYQPIYDLIFMDIKMPGMDGMTAARRLRSMDGVTVLIFVTNMVQYAVNGYEVDALDFIVKPVRYPSFEMKMKRAIQALRMKKGSEVLLSLDGVKKVLPSVSIHYIEVMNHDLTYHTEEGVFRTRGKLGAAEQQLPAESFFRCSVSYLINLRYVTQVSGDTVQVAGNELPVSRGKRKELMTAIAAYLGRGV